jgi:hypothetical protein
VRLCPLLIGRLAVLVDVGFVASGVALGVLACGFALGWAGRPLNICFVCPLLFVALCNLTVGIYI